MSQHPVRTPARTTVRAGVGALLLGLAASGCGVAGTDYQPGAAATVEGTRVTTATVDEYATYFCDAVAGGAFGDLGAVARLELKQGVAGNLARRLAAERFAEDAGVEPGEYYEEVVTQAEQGLASLPEEDRDALVEVQTAEAYVNEVALAAGEQDLAAQGDSDPGPEEAQARGNELFLQWLGGHEVEIDPGLGIEIAPDGTWARTDTSTSVPGSDLALVAAGDPVDATGQPDPAYSAYVSSLPSSQRCG